MTDSTTTPEAFYLPLGADDDGAEIFTPTDATRSVWSTEMQHGSPPAALMVRAMENHGARDGARLSSIVVDLLGPVAVTQTRVETKVLRPGRNIELLGASLSTMTETGEYLLAATATAWRMATADTFAAIQTRDPMIPVREIDESLGFNWGQTGYTYVDALEWRWLAGASADGPGLVWARPRLPLVLGEEPSAMQNMFNVVDAANGVGATLDPTKWTFLNTDLSVHLHRAPQGEWIGIAAESSIGPDGIGMSSAVIHDQAGPVGRAAQSLLVRPR
ncbi:thioesterase family protein [Tomitella biformata]|uniref:thioesterase family protein n=1 Tax=Tomitella biformata TaxID=630403 RepID=UPI0004661CE2|nr:thioesterase family protein [Tomitella biformata]